MSGKFLDADAYANTIIQGDSLTKLRELPDGIVNCCVTSPPYYALRDYGVDGQIGLEETPEKYISDLVDVFREVRRVLRDDGTLWVNIGDSYWGSGSRGVDATDNPTMAGKLQMGSKGTVNLSGVPKLTGNYNGIKNKDIIGIPWMLAFALRADGWYLRQDIIWQKPNPMPESVKDRCTKSHEYIFLLSKNPKYYFDSDVISEPCSRVTIEDFARRKKMGNKGKAGNGYGTVRPDLIRSRENFVPKNHRRNKRDVWSVPTKPIKEAHFATFPEKLIEPCILAGCPSDGIVLDPFFGSGTTGRTALKLGRKYIGIELNPEYIEICIRRTEGVQMEMTGL